MTVRCSTYGKGRVALTEALRNRQDFQTGGALRGANRPLPHSIPPLGELDEDNRRAFVQDATDCGIVYIVWSYETPIAWAYPYDGGINVHHVSQKFSNTTTRHQHIAQVYM